MRDRFIELFTGAVEAYGYYNVEEGPAGQKLLGSRDTVRERVTVEQWAQHLNGERGLGIIPIDNESNCRWACIDIDRYDLNHQQVVMGVERRKLPLVLCRSKSGGGHLFVFFKEPVSADRVRKKLQELAAGLGYGDCEIYPKQSQVLYDRGDLGSWLNMPYFDADNTMRYGFGSDGRALLLDEFLDFAEARRIDLKTFLTLSAVDPAESLSDGPPCLQYITAQGAPEGTRNKVLFQYDIYAKRKFIGDWEQRVEMYNHQHMDPPLPSAEVQNIVKSLSRKEYAYSCHEQPCNAFCEKGVCQTRQYGVGGGAMPTVGSLTKLNTDPPIWFMSIGTENKRIELTTEALQNQTKFQAACMEQANIMPTKMKEANWQQLIQTLLDRVDVIEIPADASPTGQFYNLLESFVSSQRTAAKTKEELLLGRPWTDETVGRVYFRMEDLLSYLDRHRFKRFDVSKVAQKLRELGRQKGFSEEDLHKFFNIKGKGVNVWCVPKFEEQQEEYDLPEMPKEVL